MRFRAFDAPQEPSVAPARAPLRLGIDGEALRRPLSGVGQYVFHLCRELEVLLPEARLFAYARLPAGRLALPSARWQLRQESSKLLRRLPSFLWLRTRGAQLAARDRLDVFWAGRTLQPRLAAPVRTVCTLHDLNHLIVPDTMEAATLWSHRLWLAGDLARADCVVANSQGTAQRVRERLGLTVHGVVLPGLTEAFRPITTMERPAALSALAALGIRPPFFLSVATLEPRKNVEALFRAFVDLKRRGELSGYQLVLAGARGWSNEGLSHALQEAAVDGVVMAGYVPDALMPALYSLAQALVCPSRYEGFGMPVLEARACGTRVVIADVPELREAGGAEAIVVGASHEGLCAGLREAERLPLRIEPGLADRHGWRLRAAQLLALMVERPAIEATSGSRRPTGNS